MSTHVKTEVCVYGKLPLARDFLWWNLDAGWSFALRGLVDQAASAIGRGSSDAGTLALAFASSATDTVYATIRPSGDQGGLRAFPFAIGSRVHGGGLTLDQLWWHTASHDSWFQTLSTLKSHEEFGECSARLAVAANAHGRRATAPAPRIRPLLGTCFSSNAQAARAFWRLHLLVRGVESLAELAPERTALVLPLGDQIRGTARQWEALLAPSCNQGRPEALLVGDRTWPTLLVVWDGPRASHLRALAEQAPDLIDLRKEHDPADRQGFEAFAANLDALLRAPTFEPSEWLALLRAPAHVPKEHSA